MALTKDQIIARLARHLVDDTISLLSWAQLVLAVQGLTAEQKAALLEAVRSRDGRQVGQLMGDAVRAWAVAQAQADAATMLTNDVLTLADLEKILRA